MCDWKFFHCKLEYLQRVKRNLRAFSGSKINWGLDKFICCKFRWLEKVERQLREKVVGQLHNYQLRVPGMKALSRSYVWWLNIHRDIENFVGNCKGELQSDTWSTTDVGFWKCNILTLIGKTIITYSVWKEEEDFIRLEYNQLYSEVNWLVFYSTKLL